MDKPIVAVPSLRGQAYGAGMPRLRGIRTCESAVGDMSRYPSSRMLDPDHPGIRALIPDLADETERVAEFDHWTRMVREYTEWTSANIDCTSCCGGIPLYPACRVCNGVGTVRLVSDEPMAPVRRERRLLRRYLSDGTTSTGVCQVCQADRRLPSCLDCDGTGAVAQRAAYQPSF